MEDLDIKIGSKVELLYFIDKRVHTFEVVEIYLEAYISDYKTIVRAQYYNEKYDLWVIDKFFSNDFIKAINEAKEEIRQN